MDWEKLYSISNSISSSDSSMSEQLRDLKPSERYTRPKPIKEGSMKVISTSTDQATGRIVAYATPKSPKKDFIESFLREAQITALLQHPNIVSVYDIGFNGKKPFFTMKLIEGEALSDLIFNAPEKRPLLELINFFLATCQAVSYAHSKGIIHLDLKPDNIQISPHGEVLVTDWGLAKVIDWSLPEQESLVLNDAFQKADLVQNTLFGHIKGTPGYLSPEQADTEVKNKSYSSDIYSLGAILYSILTQQVPIQGNDLEEILEKTINGKVLPPRLINKKIPKALEAICLKAMAKESEKRYQTVDELISDIKLYQRGFSPKAQKESLLTQAQLYVRRKPFIFVGFAIYITTIGTLSILSNFTLSQKNLELQKQEENANFERNKVIQQNNKSSQNYTDMAQRAATNNKLDEAKIYLTIALELNPKNKQALALQAKLSNN